MPQIPASSNFKLANYLIIISLLLNLFFAHYIIWFNLNYLQIDLAGHIASAASFGRGYFHQFQDSFFLGYIQNLFYPPLEDLIIYILSLFSANDYILAYKIYLSLILIFYFFGIYLISTRLATALSRCVFIAAFLIVFNVEKPELLHFQGLSLVDIWLTGLSTQILAFVLFIFLVYEILSSKKPHKILVFLFLSICSHIIIALISCILFGLFCLEQRKKTYWLCLIFAVLLSSFYTIPFLAYSSYLVSSKIFGQPHAYFFYLSVFLLLINVKIKELRPFFMTSCLLFASIYVGPLLEKIGLLIPAFHYYRLAMPALIIMIIAQAYSLNSLSNYKKIQKIAATSGVVALLLVLHFEFSLQRYSLEWPSL